MSVRYTLLVRSPADLAGDADFVEKTQHDPHGMWIAVLLEPPDRFDLNVNHLVEQTFIYPGSKLAIDIIFLHTSSPIIIPTVQHNADAIPHICNGVHMLERRMVKK